ncbi:MAG TPA: AAA family ATPase, partial [Flavobacteriaceae bacterium]|nr:AAA family ATPase [Flavobacteriaceae bacterium]
MTKPKFYNSLVEKFPFTPTAQQDITLQKLADFILEEEKDRVFMLKGYAGTGKTSIIGTLTKSLWKIKMKSVLIAPTGRAAKVMANYSGHQAFTIHRKIYQPKKSGVKIEFTLQKNRHKDTIFIVDEASMISDFKDGGNFSTSGALLDDLMEYVYSGRNCKLIFIGDTAQLPPVNMELSPALDHNQVSLNYQKEVDHIELTEVVRQQQESGILSNATDLRNHIRDGFYDTFKFDTQTGDDMTRLIDGDEIMNAIHEAYDNLGHEETALIVQSNKRANLYNQQIRARILFR